MNCQEILIDYLKDNGYDGLANPSEECGCLLSYFAACDGCVIDCYPGKAVYKDGVFVGVYGGDDDEINVDAGLVWR